MQNSWQAVILFLILAKKAPKNLAHNSWPDLAHPVVNISFEDCLAGKKKFVAQKLREQKCFPLCLVVITDHKAHFVITFCEKRKVVCENCMGEPHAKVLFMSFFSQSKFIVNTFRNMPFDLEHSINVMKHKLYIWGGGWGDISSMRL